MHVTQDQTDSEWSLRCLVVLFLDGRKGPFWAGRLQMRHSDQGGRIWSHEEKRDACLPALCPEPVPVIRKVTDEHLSSLCFCSFTCRQLSWGPCRNAGFDSLSPEGDLSVFISSKFPSDADAAGPRPSDMHCLIAVVTSPSGQWFVRSFPRGRASLTRERLVPWKSLPLPCSHFGVTVVIATVR